MSDKKSSDSGSSLKSIEDVISSIRDNVVPKKEGSLRFIIPRDKEGNIKEFEQPDPKPFIIPRDKEGNRIPFDPKEGIQLLSERFEINGMPTTREGFEMFTNKFQRLNDQGKMMFQMLLEKNPEAGAEKILDAIMGRQEFLSNEKTVSDILDERTQSKADGGIVQLFGNM
tara:strand:+ start:58 stop:567 length:510 start_codon:yes stop_codon:yes gene_type:complete